jgi:hypothetical protein
MTKEQIELARRAVACRGWRWMPGMLTSHGARCLGSDLWVDRGQRVAVYADPNEGEAPDLDDPATLGCLLALVREAWEPRRGTDCIASSVHTNSGWGVGARVGSECFAAIVLPAAASEAEALVAALEAAP